MLAAVGRDIGVLVLEEGCVTVAATAEEVSRFLVVLLFLFNDDFPLRLA